MSNLTKHGNNADIQIHILPEKQMRQLGFTDCVKTKWYLCKNVANSITFNVTIWKDGSEWEIDILDEDFLQPYDYQYMLSCDKYPPFAQKVKSIVDDYMLHLIDVGLISNWKVGDYI